MTRSGSSRALTGNTDGRLAKCAASARCAARKSCTFERFANRRPVRRRNLPGQRCETSDDSPPARRECRSANASFELRAAHSAAEAQFLRRHRDEPAEDLSRHTGASLGSDSGPRGVVMLSIQRKPLRSHHCPLIFVRSSRAPHAVRRAASAGSRQQPKHRAPRPPRGRRTSTSRPWMSSVRIAGTPPAFVDDDRAAARERLEHRATACCRCRASAGRCRPRRSSARSRPARTRPAKRTCSSRELARRARAGAASCDPAPTSVSVRRDSDPGRAGTRAACTRRCRAARSCASRGRAAEADRGPERGTARRRRCSG